MSGDVDIASIAAVLADPTRVRILFALGNNKALPATELARIVRVSPSAASFHLTKLIESGLLIANTRGKYRYFQVANERVAPALEALATIAPEESVVSLRQSRRAEQVRFGRLCQEHMGGFIGVRFTDTFLDQSMLIEVPDGYELTEHGSGSLRALGIPVTSGGDRFVPRHPDWSEDSHHMAGVVATSLARFMLDQGWIQEIGSDRAVRITGSGREAILKTFGIDFESSRG
jgi:DNA-binding transcriptional ArsR family regulator